MPPEVNPSSDEPQLDPPGAGLPRLATLLARYFFFPKYCRSSSWEKSSDSVEKSRVRITNLTKPLAAEPMQKRVLVYGIQGIEDSSRFWSVAMTLEHLVITNRAMGDVVVALSRGQVPPGEASTATVKPKGGGDAAFWKAEYQKSIDEYHRKIVYDVVDKKSKTTFAHPWFGNLTAYRWHCLVAIHQNTHRQQIEQILRRM
jgi:hypothetical protein